jgi:hypothetical protein
VRNTLRRQRNNVSFLQLRQTEKLLEIESERERKRETERDREREGTKI